MPRLSVIIRFILLLAVLSLPKPTLSQQIVADLQAEGKEAYFAEPFGMRALRGSAVRDFIKSVMKGPPVAPDARYKIEGVCYFDGTDDDRNRLCGKFWSDFNAHAQQETDDLAPLRLFFERLDLQISAQGLPTEDGGFSTDTEGFQFIVRLIKTEVADAPTPHSRSGEQDPPVPDEPVTSVMLAPDLVPHTLRLTQLTRPAPKGITFQFEVTPTWTGELDAPPALITLAGEDGHLFSVHMLEDRSGIAVSGDGLHVLPVGGAFEAGRTSWVSLRSGPEDTTLYIDGKFAGAIDAGFRPGGEVQTITIGALSNYGAPFSGTIGKVAVWGSSLEHVFESEVVSRRDHDVIPFDVRLIASTDRSAPRFTMIEAPAWSMPRPGWYRQMGQIETRIHNLEDFVRGRAAPNMSPLHEAVDAFVGDGATYSPSARSLLSQISNATIIEGENAEHSQFSIHPLYRVTVDEGLDPERYFMRDEDGELVAPNRRLPAVGEVSGLLMKRGGDAVDSFGFISCARPEGTAREEWFPYRHLQGPGILAATAHENFRLQCEAAPENRWPDWIWFGPYEGIRGMTWRVSKSGHVVSLFIHTNRNTYGPFATGPQQRGEITRFTETKSIWMDPGVGFYGLEGVSDETGFRDLAFQASPFMLYPGITITAENGDALRFFQQDPNFFRGMSAHFPTPQAVAPFDNPTIIMPEPDVMLTTGIDSAEDWAFGTQAVELERIDEKPTVVPNDTYNNTFVALSKAVNLQANYVGYDIIQMDPIHLNRTGAAGRLFGEPKGRSRDYYDFNRIFVPRGLAYVPEFTGDLHKDVRETSTYQEFKNAVSNSVSVGLSSKALPTFSMSSTMREAAETISENKMSRTIATSRAYFYDLILEKNEIRLDDEFRSRVERLAERGNIPSFIESYGTHYAIGVVYGGAAVLTVDTSEETRGSLLQKGIDTKTQVGLLLDADTETSLSIGFDNSKDTTQQFRSTVGRSNENFYWIGGAHVGLGPESWSLGSDGVVPLHVVLRPLDELLSAVFFPDPEVHIRLRHALREAIDEYIDSHRGIEPPSRLVPSTGFLEARMDHLYCGRVPPDRNLASWGKLEISGGTQSMRYPPPSNGATLEPVSAVAFPYISISAYDEERRHMANFADPPPPPKDDDNKLLKPTALKVICNTYDDIIPKSQYLQNQKNVRVALSAESLLKGALLEINDFRAKEYKVVHHHISDDATRKELGTEAFLDGLTLGGKILWDEYVTGEGSKVVDYFKQKRNPDQIPNGLAYPLTIKEWLCDDITGGPCPLQSKGDYDAIAGKWFHKVIELRPPEKNCGGCLTYELHFSLRYIQ